MKEKAKKEEPPVASRPPLVPPNFVWSSAADWLATIPLPSSPTFQLFRDLDGDQWIVTVERIGISRFVVTFDKKGP